MADECKPTLNTGLRGVAVASTKISDVIGHEGKLIYRGFLVKDLAEKASYEEVVYLLLFEKMPKQNELRWIKEMLVKERAIPEELTKILQSLPKDTLPMDILQGAVSMMAAYDPDAKTENSRDAALRITIRLVARLATVLAAWVRIRKGMEPVLPSRELDHAANFLYMMTGEIPEKDVAHFFDVCMVLHAEHSFNASTFTARQIASTKAHTYSAISGAIGSLSGALHGGANTRVMKMLKDIGTIDNIESYVKEQLDSGGKIMGLGHAVYKVDDPRALILAPMSKIMGEKIGQTKWYQMSVELEKKAKKAFKEKKGMDIFVNVDFYSASLYYAMGIPIDIFTPVFAISRVAGWCAHVIEEQFAEAAPKATLYRPESIYVGEYCGPEECVLEPIERR